MPSSLVSLKSARARFFAHPRLRPFELVKPAKEKAHSKQRADSATVRERPEQFLRLRLAQSCAATNQQGRGPSGPLSLSNFGYNISFVPEIEAPTKFIRPYSTTRSFCLSR